jgi:hypothetical protein
MARTRYFVVFAPNHYGSGGSNINDTTTVLSAHVTYRNALKSIQDTTTLVIRFGPLRKGDNFARHSENHYPYATGDES